MLYRQICHSIAVCLANNVLAPLATMGSCPATDSTIQRKMYGGITFAILNEDMDNIRIIKLLEK